MTEGSWHPAARFVAVPGFGRVHAVHLPRPDAPAVVFLHGFLQSSWAWRDNLAAFAADRAVAALCVPGFGWSEMPRGKSYRLAAQAERVIAACDALGIARAAFVGNSLGAALALQVALVDPARVSRLVLVIPASTDLGVWSAPVAVHHPVWEPVWHLPGLRTLFTLGLRHVAYRRTAIDRRFADGWFARFDAPGARAAAVRVLQHYHRDLRALDARLPDLRLPVLMVAGRRDRIVPARALTRVAERLGGAPIAWFDDCGHCPMEEDPPRFNAVVRRFLDGAGS